ncbi:unnamed protein product [Microthlaspi erraticum]|uniref:Apple domain-containing protein n=1 Tax=Microthlaspi erraticum TaxID=1685480 RepID=A0A6D2K2W7_9BRAS|nr:unnamed protein product [Microthlaspi erraticum]
MEPRYTSIYTTTYNSSEEITYSLRVGINASYFAALKLSYDGVLRWLIWTPGAGGVKAQWELPGCPCDKYEACGPNSYYFMNPLQTCKCLPGFRQQRETPNAPHGCVRESRLSCGIDDGFHRLRNMKLPQLYLYETILNMTLGSEECEERCLSYCNCTAFANAEMPNGAGSGCLMWTGDLIDLRTYTNDHQGQDLHVKVSAAHIREFSLPFSYPIFTIELRP